MVAPTVGMPVISDAPHRHVLYQHFVVPEDQIAPTMQRAFAALYGYIGNQHAIPAGPPFVSYNTAQSPWDMDVCAPVAAPIPASGDFLYMELPSSRVVTMTNIGPYEQIGQAYDVMESYIRDNKLTMAGSPREIYLSPPETPPSEIQTILEWPID